jgi:GST-like protein
MMELWTAATPNGWKVNIMAEELKEAGVEMPELKMRSINLMEGEQFSEEFTRHNPNQKIPVLIDGEISVMESCAILQYLGEKYSSNLLPNGDKRWDVLQWLFWQAANVGPIFGNKLSYTRYMDDVSDDAKAHPLERFGKEGLRLASVLNNRLEGRDYVCGNDITIADIAIYPWVRGWKWSKINMTDKPNVMAWIDRVRARPAVERALSWGMPKDEIDQWSEKRKADTARSGATIAANDNLRTEG